VSQKKKGKETKSKMEANRLDLNRHLIQDTHGPGPVAHLCNPSHSEGREWKDRFQFDASLDKKLAGIHFNK
jgi:hypothetical protein